MKQFSDQFMNGTPFHLMTLPSHISLPFSTSFSPLALYSILANHHVHQKLFGTINWAVPPYRCTPPLRKDQFMQYRLWYVVASANHYGSELRVWQCLLGHYGALAESGTYWVLLGLAMRLCVSVSLIYH
jgi:hypothetical protein